MRRIADRCPVRRALLGGARVADVRAPCRSASAGPSRHRADSEHFDGVPWLERVYQVGSLWDSYEMGAPADIHCYTPPEFERKRESCPPCARRPSMASSCCPRRGADPLRYPAAAMSPDPTWIPKGGLTPTVHVTCGRFAVSYGCSCPRPRVTLLRTQSDQRLAVLAAGGHERAFEAIVERYRRSLLRHRAPPTCRRPGRRMRCSRLCCLPGPALRAGRRRARAAAVAAPDRCTTAPLNALRSSGYDYDELPRDAGRERRARGAGRAPHGRPLNAPRALPALPDPAARRVAADRRGGAHAGRGGPPSSG